MAKTHFIVVIVTPPDHLGGQDVMSMQRIFDDLCLELEDYNGEMVNELIVARPGVPSMRTAAIIETEVRFPHARAAALNEALDHPYVVLSEPYTTDRKARDAAVAHMDRALD